MCLQRGVCASLAQKLDYAPALGFHMSETTTRAESSSSLIAGLVGAAAE
jgi:hypothetical protein